MQTNKLYKFIAISIIIGLLLPFLVLILWAFTASWPVGDLLPADFGLRGWKYVLAPHSKVMISLGTSVALAAVVTICALLVSIPAGKALGFYDFPGKGWVQILVMAPIIIPSVTVGMGLHMNFIKFGLADTILGVLLVHLVVVLPYGIRIFASAYQAMGMKWDKQAQILKAKWWQRWWYVTLPMLAPALVSASILMFNVSFSQYFLTFLIGGGNVVTLPVLLFPFVNSGDRVVASAMSMIFIVVAVVLMMVIENIIGDEQEREFYYL